MCGGGDGRRGDRRGGLRGKRRWGGRGGGTAPGRGTGQRHARTSSQRVGGGCVARVRRGGRRFSVAYLSGYTALSCDQVCFNKTPIREGRRASRIASADLVPPIT